MADFMKIFISFMLLGIILFGIFSFTATIQDQNAVERKVEDNSLINNTFNDFNANVSTLRDRSAELKKTFESENPTTGFGSILFLSIVSVGKSVTNMIMGIFNTITVLPGSVLGVDPVILGILTTILVISLIIGIWIIYKLGS